MGYWITVVDDEPLSLTNARSLLNAQGFRVSCLRSGAELLTFMEKNTPDLVLLDIMMPQMDGFETYHALRRFEDGADRNPVPVIFLTGESDTETERRGLRAGASDFIHKPLDRDILVERVNNTIVNWKKIESLTEEASLDKLTGFLNKDSGTKKAAELCAERAGAFMVLDLDNFKLVNDLFGHDMGDRILVAFADIVRFNIRNDDLVCRIGGDEFLAFFCDVTSAGAVAAITKRFNEQMDKRALELLGEDHRIPLGISVGVSFAPEQARDYNTLFQYADSALYHVKLNGKHGYDIYGTEAAMARSEDSLEREMARVTMIVEERGDGKGALILGQEAFSWNYRLIMRYIERYGGTATKILFSLAPVEEGDDIQELITGFSEVLRTNMRKSDIIFRNRPDQFFVVQSLLGKEHEQGVVNRILAVWGEIPGSDKVNVRYITATVTVDSESGQ